MTIHDITFTAILAIPVVAMMAFAVIYTTK